MLSKSVVRPGHSLPLFKNEYWIQNRYKGKILSFFCVLKSTTKSASKRKRKRMKMRLQTHTLAINTVYTLHDFSYNMFNKWVHHHWHVCDDPKC